MRHYRKNWIISYDIGNARRLRRVYRLCCDSAVTLQQSIFWAEFNNKELAEFLHTIEGLIDTQEDSVKVMPVGALSTLFLVGQSRLPEEMEDKTNRLGNSHFDL